MRRVDWGGLVLAIGFAAPTLYYPFFRDQAIFAYVGWGWLDGYLPYVDSFDNKPPAIFALYALLGLLTREEWGIRVLDILAATGLGGLAALLTAPRGKPAAWGAGALFASGLYFSGFDYARAAQVEIWEGLALGLSLLAAMRRRVALAGALGGLAFLFKLPAVLPAMCVAGYASVMLPRPWSWAAGARIGAVYALSALCVIAASSLPWVLAGEGTAFWDGLIGFNLHYAGNPEETHAPWSFLVNRGQSAAAVVLMLGVLGLRGRQRRGGLLGWLGFCVALWLSVAIQQRFWHYHFGVTVIGLCCVALWGVQRVTAGRGAQLGLTAAAVGLMVVTAVPWSGHHELSYRGYTMSAAQYALGRIDADRFYAPFRLTKGYRYRSIREIAALISARAAPGDTLCVHRVEPGINTLTGLRCPSRFVSERHIRHEYTRDFKRAAWREEHYQSQLREPPTFVVAYLSESGWEELTADQGYRAIGEVVDRIILMKR